MFNIILILLVQLALGVIRPVSAQDLLRRNRETNPNYREGDWISYSDARFVTSIAVGDQYVYFGTLHSGITRLDPFQNRWTYPWTTSNGLADNEVWAVAYDADTGYLWCATRTAISYYHPTARRWRNFFKDEFGLPFSDRVESIGIGQDRVFFETRARRLFEASKFGGVVLVASRGLNNGAGNNDIRWFGRRAKKVRQLPHFFMTDGYIFNPGGEVEDRNFRRAKVSVVVEDQWSNLWVGTWGLGVGRGDLRTQRLEMLNFGLVNPSVNALNFYDKVLWIGGLRPNLRRSSFEDAGGITAWDQNREVWTTYEQRDISDLESDEVYSITVDDDDIWFSTNHGLTRYSIPRNRWKTFDRYDGLSDNVVFDTVVDDSSIWVGTANGIDRIFKQSLATGKKDSLKLEHINAGDLTIVRVRDLELMENLLWAATDNGIYVYDTKKRMGGFSDEINGPQTRTITSISRYENEVWFGSLEGIDVYDVEKREWLGVPEGRFFPNRVINKIVAAHDAVWAATNRGVLKFNRKDKTWRTFTTEDGLISNRVNAILLDGDNIWFGTDRGLTQFFWNDPSRID